MGTVKKALACVAWLAASHAGAGTVEGTHLVWFNLSDKPAVTDRRIGQYLNQEPAAPCWASGSLLFMRDKPPAITQALVTRAVVLRDKDALQALEKILKRPYKEASSGFDGIVVYHDRPRPVLYSMGLRPRTLSRETVHEEKHPQYLEHLFCSIAPEISRPP